MTSPTIDALNGLLADYQVLYQKLRGYHWNVHGPQFFALHAKFEELYLAAAERVDQLAERIAALGGQPLSTLKAQLAAARLAEDDTRPSANDMVANLAEDYDKLQGHLAAAIETAAGDTTTVNLLEGIRDEQAQTLWMLRAYLTA